MLNLYLPGYSQKNREVLEKLTKKLQKLGWTSYGRHWPHWLTGDENADFDQLAEVENIVKLAQATKTKELGVTAKSIGTIVAFYLAATQPQLKLRYLLLTGIPIGSLRELPSEIKEKFVARLKEENFPVKVLQNSADPYGPAAEVAAELKSFGITQGEIPNFEFTTLPGEDHVYADVLSYVEFIRPYQT